MKLHDWNAKRAGGRITAYGKDELGGSSKIVGIDKIEPREGRVFATDKDGREHELVLA
jgi:hypothetical protein